MCLSIINTLKTLLYVCVLHILKLDYIAYVVLDLVYVCYAVILLWTGHYFMGCFIKASIRLANLVNVCHVDC